MDAILARSPIFDQDRETRLDYWVQGTPNSILVLASDLRERGFDVEIVDMAVDYFDIYEDVLRKGGPRSEIVTRMTERLLADLAEKQPRLFGMTCLLNSEGRIAVSVTEEVKRCFPDMTTLMGGYFPAGHWQEILESYPGVDGVAVGDGQEMCALVLQRLREGREPFDASIPNLAWRVDGRPVKTNAVQPDMRQVAPIDYGLLRTPSRYTTLAYNTSYGCPWRCNFCIEYKMRVGYFEKPTSQIRRELESFLDHCPSRLLVLNDPMIALNDKRIRELCDIFNSYDFTFIAETRIDKLSTDLVPLLAEAGCTNIWFGLESANYDTLRRMDKIRSWSEYEVYLEAAERIVEACAKNRVMPMFGVLLGYPGDVQEDLFVTFDFVRRLREIFNRAVEGMDGTAGFLVIPEVPYLPRHSDIFKMAPYYAKKGLQLEMPEDIFGNICVTRPSNYLTVQECEAFLKACARMSVIRGDEARGTATRFRGMEIDPVPSEIVKSIFRPIEMRSFAEPVHSKYAHPARV